MIALLDGLPMVRFADGATVPFERDWLLRSLATAARKAGYPQWWLAEHVAESVTTFLRTSSALPVLPVETLTRSVQQVLQVIGYAEVGRHFEAGRPSVKISLVALAQAAGTGYELAFFGLLASRIRQAVEENAEAFELFGLEPCVKLLRSRKAWSRDCAILRDEIVAFTREETGRAATAANLQFSLS